GDCGLMLFSSFTANCQGQVRMSEVIVWICLPLIALLAGQMSSRDPSLSSALAEMDKGRILQSIAQFKQIIRSEPANGPAYFYLSTLYTEMKELDVAERYLRRAMQANPNQGA